MFAKESLERFLRTFSTCECLRTPSTGPDPAASQVPHSCVGTTSHLSSEASVKGSFRHISAIHCVLQGDTSPPTLGRSVCHCREWRWQIWVCAQVGGPGQTAWPWTSLRGVGHVHTSSHPAKQSIKIRTLVLEMWMNFCGFNFFIF